MRRVCRYIVNLTFIVGLVATFRQLGAAVPLPLHQLALLSLPLLALGPSVAVLVFASAAWRKGWWTRTRRIGYVAYAVVCVMFTAFLRYWNLLGYHY